MDQRQAQNSTYVFLGTPDFGARVLEKLVEADLRPSLVITRPDKLAGRNHTPVPSEVKIAAGRLGVAVFETEDPSAVAEKLQALKPRFLVLASYGVLLPRRALEAPLHGALNIHPSLLPKYRGPSPVQSAILAGEKTTGVSIMLMDEEIDHGPVLAQREVPIGTLNSTELTQKLAVAGAELLVEILPQWLEGTLSPVPQDHEQATFTKRFTREDGRIDWANSAAYLERQVRAFDPWPGAYTFWQGKRFKILEAAMVEGNEGVLPGEVFRTPDGGLAVQAGKGALRVDKLQLEGKNPVGGREFLLGHPDIIGMVC